MLLCLSKETVFETLVWPVASFLSELQLGSFCLTGLFNVGNRLLVSIDLFLKVRASIKVGQHPSQVVRTILDHITNHPGKHWIQLCIHKFCVCRLCLIKFFEHV